MALSTVILLLTAFGGFLVFIHGFARVKQETTRILDHYQQMLIEARDALEEDAEQGAHVTDGSAVDAQEMLDPAEAELRRACVGSLRSG